MWPVSGSYLDSPTPLAFAHRGGSGVKDNLGIENSLAAFTHAYALGYRYLETDVRCTSDGVVHVFHDETLERMTGSSDSFVSLTSAQVEAERLGGRESIPTLSSLYDAFPDARFNIDVKSDDAVDATCAVIEAHGAVERTCLASFSHSRLSRIRRRLPAVATSASTREVTLVKLLPTFLLRAWGVPKSVCLQVPARHNGITVVTRRFVTRAHSLHQQVHVWTIDDAAEMTRLLDLGVDGIITDRTDILKDTLVARGSWRDPA
ncbi:MAG: glycerophosphodiester phosphodiesterase [Aeromicrobium sp.]|nr:glycerophosphodiester phosphodiesterase [Aeromicrobium sp.]